MMKRKTKWIASASAVILVAAVSCAWYLSHSNKRLIADLLDIDRLPKGTRIVSIRKDIFTDTVVDARLRIPSGAVTALLVGHDFVEHEKLYATAKRSWSCGYGNADFRITCDESGRNVEVYCAVD